MRSLTGLVLVLALTGDAAAQRPDATPSGVTLPSANHVGCRCLAVQDPEPIQRPGPSPWTVVASALIPGLGQATQRVDRAIGYVAIEAFAWTSYAWFSTDSRRHRDGYRDLASAVARSPFSTFRPNGDFEYYERMSHYPESGRYDVVPGGAVNPETDVSTYNGSVWELARRTYWSDPGTAPDPDTDAWKRSISFYQARAYQQPYRWSWMGAGPEYAEFKSRISASNDANRRAVQALTVVIANHVLSAVDAYIVVRLRAQGPESGLSLQGSIPLGRLARSRVPRIVTGSSGRSSIRQHGATPPSLTPYLVSPP